MTDLLILGPPGLDRTGLVRILQENPDTSICTVVDLGESVDEKIRKHEPDLILVYVRSLGKHNMELIREAKTGGFPARVLVLSDRSDRQTVIELLNAGVEGHVKIERGIEEVFEAIRAVAAGGRYICPSCRDPEVERALADESGEPWPEPLEQLTDREREVLQILRGGRSTQAIAEELHISVRTAERHLQNARKKLGLPDLKELLRYLLSRDPFEDDPDR